MLEINKMTGCYCTFAQRMVGDGCSICNPKYAEELRKQAEEDDLLEAAKNTEQPNKQKEATN